MTNDYEIEDGVLINYKGKDSEIIIPNGVEAIGDNVFTSGVLSIK